jgi:hypothetical protein
LAQDIWVGHVRGGGKEIPKPHGGGVFSGPHSGYPAILHSTEAVLPLDHPNLIPGILNRAGLGGGGSVSTGTVVNIHINAPVTGVDDLHEVVHDATMAAMEESYVAEGRSARGSIR